MANIIKNQILKHLSKFAKNLSHDQINLSTLKGEGELKNLELNEEVLTELLELPSWLRLTRADCNRVAIRIPWTKLKSVPIHLSLDEVRVEVETCETLRTTNTPQKKPSYASGGNYGFVDKVLDGITVTVNSVVLTLHSHAFTASFQMSRIVLESKSPSWAKVDLRMTRIKDTDKQEVLNFKELSWQTVRIEAKSTKNEDLTPLRLIANQARCRLTIKKKMTDCSVLGCRLALILDDLLWVLTDDQLKAALHFADSLSGLLKRATEETQKVKGARKLESLAEFSTKSSDSASKKKTPQACAAARVFARYDVVETSYHFYSDRIDLHLCDDPGSNGRSCHPELSEGGAFQISLSQLQLDFYPYHLAAGNRSAWIRYQESVHASWLNNSVSAFQATLLDAFTSSKNHSPLTRAPVAGGAPQVQSLANGDLKGIDTAVRDSVLVQFKKLLTTNLVVRLSNFCMWKVSTSKEKVTPQEFISGERERFSLPDDMPVVHFEYTQFYYPGGLDFPVPPPKFFAYINPVQILLDHLTVLWLNAFSLNLQQSVKLLSLEKAEPPYLDVKIEAIMLRVIIEAPKESPVQKDRPKALHLQVSRILAANYRSLETGSKADLAEVLDRFQKSELYFGTDFPNYPSDIPTVCDKMLNHATGSDDVGPALDGKLLNLQANNRQDMWKVMKKDLFWTEAKDVWYVFLDPVWADFHGTPSSNSRPVPLLDAFPISLWLYKQPDVVAEPPPAAAACSSSSSGGGVVSQAKMHILGSVSSLVSVQLNHFQLLFLLRAVEMISEITTFLNQDVQHILGEEDESSVAVGFVAPQIDISLLMPAVSQSRDSIGGDYDSVVPDTSSIYSAADLILRDPGGAAASADFSDRTSSSDDGTVKSHHSSDDVCPITSSSPDLIARRRRSSPSPNRRGSAVDQQSRRTPSRSPMRYPMPTIQLHSTPQDGGSLSGSPGNSSKKSGGSLSSSLSNMMASLDTSLRMGSQVPSVSCAVASSSSMGNVQENDDAVSIRSDGSSDSENFVLISQAESESARETFDSALFALHNPLAAPVAASPVEYALEVTEDGERSGSRSGGSSSTHTPRAVSEERPAVVIEPHIQREGMISVATFHIGRFELAQQSIGSHACVKLQAASLSSEECPAISWEEFQSKFTLRGKGWSESTLQPPASWCFRLRFSTNAPNYKDLLQQQANSEIVGMPLRERISRSADAFLELRAQNLPLQFYLSTLNGLGDLAEDEIIPSPIPMKIRLENIALHLIEDRPSPNITSPGSLPIDFAIPALTITRDRSGLFSIQSTDFTNNPRSDSVSSVTVDAQKRPSSTSTSSFAMAHHLDLVRSGVASIETELQQRASLLAIDNANLRALLDGANAELQTLRRKVQEGDAAQRRLAKAQQQLLATEKENKSIKQTLKFLQQELVKAGKKV